MDTLLINPPYQTITSNWGVGHQVPLGLLMVGGALRDAGFPVSLLDAEAGHLTVYQVAEQVRRRRPAVVMTGHAGSTPAHPVCMALLAAVKRAYPQVRTVYGGVFPTYHDRPVLRQHPQVDVVVRGEGEATAAELLTALRGSAPLSSVAGISYRDPKGIVRNPDRAPIRELDGYRTGWELVEDWDRYQCFGRGRDVRDPAPLDPVRAGAGGPAGGAGGPGPVGLPAPGAGAAAPATVAAVRGGEVAGAVLPPAPAPAAPAAAGRRPAGAPGGVVDCPAHHAGVADGDRGVRPPGPVRPPPARAARADQPRRFGIQRFGRQPRGNESP